MDDRSVIATLRDSVPHGPQLEDLDGIFDRARRRRRRRHSTMGVGVAMAVVTLAVLADSVVVPGRVQVVDDSPRVESFEVDVDRGIEMLIDPTTGEPLEHGSLDLWAPDRGGGHTLVVLLPPDAEPLLSAYSNLAGSELFARELAQRGLVVAHVDWLDVLANAPHPDGAQPRAVHDPRILVAATLCAIRAARTVAPDVGADPERVVLVGIEDGAWPAMLAGLDPSAFDRPDLCRHSATSARPSAVVALAGYYSVTPTRLEPLVELFPGAQDDLDLETHLGGSDPAERFRLVHDGDSGFFSEWFAGSDAADEVARALEGAGHDVELTRLTSSAETVRTPSSESGRAAIDAILEEVGRLRP